MPIPSGIDLDRAASQSITARPAATQSGTLTRKPSTALSYWPGPFEREHRDAAREEAVAVHRHVRLLESIHARNRPHRRNAAALVAVRKMEPARQGLALERNPRRLDAMISELWRTSYSNSRLRSLSETFFSLFSSNGHCEAAVVHGRHEIVRSRGDELSGLLRGLRFLPRGGAAVDSKAGEISANFCTRWRIAAKSAFASGPQGAL